MLRQDFPFLLRLSDKRHFQELVGMVRSGSLRKAQNRIAALLLEDQGAIRLPTSLAIR